MGETKESVVATIVLPEKAGKETEIQNNISAVELQASNMVVSNDAEYAQAAEFGKKIKESANAVTDYFKPMKDTAHQAHKAVCDKEKAMLKPLQEAEKTLKKTMAGYCQEQERKRKELETQMRKEAEAEKERKLNEAIAFEAEGKIEEAEAAMIDAQTTERVAGNAVVIMGATKVRGVSSIKDWEIESIDANEVPTSLFGVMIRPVDDKAVMRLIKASKGTIQIPGVKYKETTRISIRRS